MTPTARRAAFVARAAELVRAVCEDPSAVTPPLSAFRNLKTPGARRAWLAAARVDIPTNQEKRTES